MIHGLVCSNCRSQITSTTTKHANYSYSRVLLTDLKVALSVPIMNRQKLLVVICW